MRIDPLVEKRTHPSCRSFFSGWILGRGKMHFYQFHIGDYKSHTHHLSLIEDLAFRRLLDHYYLHEYPILQRDIARQIGMREHEQEVLTVLNEFFVSTDKGFVNPRADSQIKTFREHQAVSAWGAFCRDNPKIKEFAEKDVYIQRFSDGTHNEYISTLKTHHLPMMGTSSTHDATNNQEPITNNHSIDEPPTKQRTKGSRLSTDFELPDSWTEFCQTERPDLNPQKVFDSFKDYWVAKAGAAGVKLDWQATWRNWVRNQNIVKPLFNKADIVHQTVPSSSFRDPALVKLDEDRLKTAPPNPEVLARMRALLGRQA
jgi:uncharacterized protein YdaU (DUF1376 family)